MRAFAALTLGFLLWGAAHAGSGDPKFINTGKVLPSDLPFSDAVQVGNTLYLSGQVGVVPGKMQLIEGGMAAESIQALANIRTVLEASGYSMADVVKCTVMLADMSKWSEFNRVYERFFEPPYPARSAFGASGLALGAQVEVECIAAKGGE